jgi:hypothetical protein
LATSVLARIFFESPSDFILNPLSTQIIMRSVFTLLFLCLAVPPLWSQESAVEQGFTAMFDGKTFDGWKINENPESWKIEDGSLVAHGKPSHLFYVGDGKPFKDFHFKAEVMTTPGSNGGIYFHTRFQETGWPRYGFECQVNITHKDKKKSSGLYAVQDVFEPPVKDNQWYTQEIIVQGQRVVLKLNGQTMVDYTEPAGKAPFDGKFERRLGEGTFALQAHDPDSLVYFRNLRVKRLSP